MERKNIYGTRGQNSFVQEKDRQARYGFMADICFVPGSPVSEYTHFK
jgi:hypothetical protein